MMMGWWWVRGGGRNGDKCNDISYSKCNGILYGQKHGISYHDSFYLEEASETQIGLHLHVESQDLLERRRVRMG